MSHWLSFPKVIMMQLGANFDNFCIYYLMSSDNISCKYTHLIGIYLSINYNINRFFRGPKNTFHHIVRHVHFLVEDWWTVNTELGFYQPVSPVDGVYIIQPTRPPPLINSSKIWEHRSSPQVSCKYLRSVNNLRIYVTEYQKLIIDEWYGVKI